MRSLHEPIEPITSPLKAIRANCVDCMGGQARLVSSCELAGCPLWNYRMGKNPFRTRKVSEEERERLRTRMKELRKRETV
jgi:hypothetical protein